MLPVNLNLERHRLLLDFESRVDDYFEHNAAGARDTGLSIADRLPVREI